MPGWSIPCSKRILGAVDRSLFEMCAVDGRKAHRNRSPRQAECFGGIRKGGGSRGLPQPQPWTHGFEPRARDSRGGLRGGAGGAEAGIRRKIGRFGCLARGRLTASGIWRWFTAEAGGLFRMIASRDRVALGRESSNPVCSMHELVPCLPCGEVGKWSVLLWARPQPCRPRGEVRTELSAGFGKFRDDENGFRMEISGDVERRDQARRSCACRRGGRRTAPETGVASRRSGSRWTERTRTGDSGESFCANA